MPSYLAGGTSAVYAYDANTLTAALPNGILSGDAVLAFVYSTSAVSTPLGWTSRASQTFSGPTGTPRLTLFSKNAATPEDSGASFLAAQTVAGPLGVTFAVLRGVNNRAVRLGSIQTTYYFNYYTNIAPFYLSAVRDENTSLICVASSFVPDTVTTPTSDKDGVLISGSAAKNHLALFAYQVDEREAAYYPTIYPETNVDEAQVGYGVINVTAVDPTFWQSLSEVLGMSSTFNLAGSDYATAVSDQLRLKDYASQFHILLELLTDAATLARSTAYDTPVLGVVQEPVRLADAPALAPVVTATDTVDLSGAALAFYSLRQNETIRLQGQPHANLRTGQLVSQAIALAETVLLGRVATLSETLELTAAAEVVRVLTVMERLRLTDTPLASALLRMTLGDVLRLRDSLWKFLSGDVLEAVTLTDTLLKLKRITPQLTDGVELDEALTPRLLLRLTASDEIALDDGQLLKMLFASSVAEGIEIGAGYVSPNGNFTTWAVNTRTGGTTEYTNYVFNSFAKMGQRYLGASSDGLYVLDGEDDDGDDIVAAIKGGFLQFNGSRFAGFKAVYLGLHGGGEYFLKLEAGTGETYTYRIIAESMETSKVWIGKGLRHRYLSYELISTGQDFDLESIEFVPMLAQRRV